MVSMTILSPSIKLRARVTRRFPIMTFDFPVNRADAVQLAYHIYHPDIRPLPPGWTLSSRHHDVSTGLFFGVYVSSRDSNGYMIVFRGTTSADDLATGGSQLARGETPHQYAAAVRLLREVVARYQETGRAPVGFIGHSFGGVLAQLFSLDLQRPGLAVCAPGAAGLRLSSSNIEAVVEAPCINLVVEDDIIGNFGQHIGMAYVLPRAYFANGPLTPHRAWDHISTADYDFSSGPSFDLAYSLLAREYPLIAPLLRALLDNGVVDLTALREIALFFS